MNGGINGPDVDRGNGAQTFDFGRIRATPFASQRDIQ